MRRKRDMAVRRVLQFLEDWVYRPIFLVPFLPVMTVVELHHRWIQRRREDE